MDSVPHRIDYITIDFYRQLSVFFLKPGKKKETGQENLFSSMIAHIKQAHNGDLINGDAVPPKALAI